MSSFITTVPEDWASLSTPNPEFMRLLEGFPAGAQLVTAETTIASLRALGQQAPVAEKWAGVAEDNISVLMRDGYENRVRRYISEDGGEPAGPLLIMIHGGGFCVGRLEQVEEECRKWVQRHKGVAFSLDHRFAPEHKFPVPIEDCYDSIKWIASNATALKADPSKGFILGGASSGATAVMVASHFFRDENRSPPITGIYLCVPSPCVYSALPEPYASDPRIQSFQQNADAPLFNAIGKKFFADQLQADPKSSLRSPLLWLGGHVNLPPTYMQIAGMDQSRDQGLLYDEILRKEGVKTRVDIFPGLPHGFHNFLPKAGFTLEFKERTRLGFEWLLSCGL